MFKEKERKIRMSWEGIDLTIIFLGLLMGFILLVCKYRVPRVVWKEEDEDEGW